MTPRVGQTVRITHGLWAGRTGTVVDHWQSGAISVRIKAPVNGSYHAVYERTFNPDEYEATE